MQIVSRGERAGSGASSMAKHWDLPIRSSKDPWYPSRPGGGQQPRRDVEIEVSEVNDEIIRNRRLPAHSIRIALGTYYCTSTNIINYMSIRLRPMTLPRLPVPALSNRRSTTVCARLPK